MGSLLLVGRSERLRPVDAKSSRPAPPFAVCQISAQWRSARCPSLPAEPLGGEGGGIDRLMYTFEVSPPLLQEGEKREARGV